MTINKKFKIPELKIKSTYKKSAPVVLNNKLKNIFNEVDRYCDNDSIENLHSLRIAFRRFRYVMEIFYECFDKDLFQYMYNYVKDLQDLIGEGRDLDILEIKFKETEKELDKKIPIFFYNKLKKEKGKIRQTIRMELIKFIIDKEVNKFILNKKRG
ncbi:MAG: CHAD domain-containing protein [Ignavibacteria bacterium]|nr:CHAD domain-containing protein [Ignavibacteria bacterium]